MSDSDAKQKYQEMLEALKTQRDELSVKMHLASMELQEKLATLMLTPTDECATAD